MLFECCCEGENGLREVKTQRLTQPTQEKRLQRGLLMRSLAQLALKEAEPLAGDHHPMVRPGLRGGGWGLGKKRS